MRTLNMLTFALSCVIAGVSLQQGQQETTIKEAVPGGRLEHKGPSLKDDPGFRVDCDDFRTIRPSEGETWNQIELLGYSLSDAMDVAVAYAQDEQKWENVRVAKAWLVGGPAPYYEIELLTQKEKDDRTVTRRWQIYVGKDKKVQRWLVQRRLPGSAVRGDLTELPSGVLSYDIEPGDGEKLAADSKIRVHYQTTTLAGNLVFDTRYNRKAEDWDLSSPPVAGIAEGLLDARVGGQRKLVIPPDLAYGEQGRAEVGIPRNATLIYDIEILRVH